MGSLILIGFVIVAIFAPFIAPFGNNQQFPKKGDHPPQSLRFIDKNGNFHIRPFVYEKTKSFSFETGKTTWKVDKSQKHFLRFFVKGQSYKFLFWHLDIHLFGFGDPPQPVFFFGGDPIGRDIFSRSIYGARVSLAIGALAALIAIGFGATVGLISGYVGGALDAVVQRIVEFFSIIPNIPLALTLSAFLPPDLPPIYLLFGVAIVISIVTWADTSRQIRGLTLSLKETDYVIAAHSYGASEVRKIFKHIFPRTITLLIVNFTLTTAHAILAEAGLSFLGFGIRPPMVSWGKMLSYAQNLLVMTSQPWNLIPGFLIFIVILSINFVGDGLRDALDPYSA